MKKWAVKLLNLITNPWVTGLIAVSTVPTCIVRLSWGDTWIALAIALNGCFLWFLRTRDVWRNRRRLILEYLTANKGDDWVRGYELRGVFGGLAYVHLERLEDDGLVERASYEGAFGPRWMYRASEKRT